MVYLRYVFQETLRLYPAVPYNVRAALEDTTIPGGPGKPDIAVLKDEPVAYSRESPRVFFVTFFGTYLPICRRSSFGYVVRVEHGFSTFPTALLTHRC